jgi:hypothetical protein
MCSDDTGNKNAKRVFWLTKSNLSYGKEDSDTLVIDAIC